jgi:hypothetical protein
MTEEGCDRYWGGTLEDDKRGEICRFSTGLRAGNEERTST